MPLNGTDTVNENLAVALRDEHVEAALLDRREGVNDIGCAKPVP